jgi:hypothetical protein
MAELADAQDLGHVTSVLGSSIDAEDFPGVYNGL